MMIALHLLLVLFLVLANGFFVASGNRSARLLLGLLQESGKPMTPEQELKALDLSWHQAAAARDAEALGRLLADDYRLRLDAAKMLTKAQEVEAVRGSDPLFDFGRFKLEDVTARVEGGRATVSGILTARPSGGDKKSRRRYFYTRTFVNREGRWQVVGASLVTMWAEAR